MTEVRKINVAAVIDERPIGRYQYLIYVVCFLIIMFDGFDTQATAYVAPILIGEWKVPSASFGPVFAAVLLGAMIGAILFGYLADRLGRKHILAFCVLLFGVLNAATAFVQWLEPFMLLRFLCGIGLGGAIPNVMALVSEYAPARKRSTLIAVTWCGFALGAVLGGMISVPLIAKFGWSAVFIVGGVLPLCAVPVVLIALPESIKYLAVARSDNDAIHSIMVKIAPDAGYGPNTQYTLQEAVPGHAKLTALFRDGLAVGSIFLCFAFFMSLMLVYLFISWIPILLRQAGMPLQSAIMGTIVFNLAGIFGSILCTQLIDRKLTRPIMILICSYLLGAVAVYMIGFAGTSFGPIMITIFLSGFLVIGVQLSLNAFITNYYPTAIRGTGVGWSQVVGRLGSLSGPLVGGFLVAQGIPASKLFQISAFAPLLAGVSLIAFATFSPQAKTDINAGPAVSP